MDQQFIPVIEKNIPLPPRRGGAGAKGGQSQTGAVLYAMQVGDSVMLPGRKQTNIASHAGLVSRRIGDGRKYATRSVTENGVKGTRVWRVE